MAPDLDGFELCEHCKSSTSRYPASLRAQVEAEIKAFKPEGKIRIQLLRALGWSDEKIFDGK